MTAFDPIELRNAFGRFMTGVTIVTTRSAVGAPVGFTANSFTSVSLDPPLLLVCPGRFLSSYASFEQCQHFGISILSEGQQEIANIFAGYKGDRFSRVQHHADQNDVALIDGAIAQFSCTTHSAIPAGDHCVLIGKIDAFSQSDARGLGYAGGQFFSLGLERRERNPAAQQNICGAIVQDGDHVLLEQTADGYRPPQCIPSNRSSARDGLTLALAQSGVTAELGAVFSVFDDPDQGTHFAYILAQASDVATNTTLEAVPSLNLASLPYASAAIARMMQRYAAEALTRDFTLYLGDAEVGETHRLKDRT